MEYEICMPIGDWSNDGHGKFDEIDFVSNYSVDKLQEGYFNSVNQTGVVFNHNCGTIPQITRTDLIGVCVQYEDSIISDEVLDIFKKYQKDPNVDIFDELGIDDYLDSSNLAEVILWFIARSMPGDFKYQIIQKKKTYLNGFWDDTLNVQFGYGIFY